MISSPRAAVASSVPSAYDVSCHQSNREMMSADVRALNPVIRAVRLSNDLKRAR
jgi:hypothetical protein